MRISLPRAAALLLLASATAHAASVTVTIRNPCPPGDVEHEMMAMRSLPGRGRK